MMNAICQTTERQPLYQHKAGLNYKLIMYAFLTKILRKHVLPAFLLSLCLSLLPAVYADNLPDMGSAIDRIASPQLEQAIGRQFMRELRKHAKILDDIEVQAYLQNLGNRLLSYSDRANADFHFFIIDDSSINAFAVPGGYIGVHSGLFLAATEEAELASVIAHEIAHVTQRHTVRSFAGAQEYGMTELAALLLVALAVGSDNPDAAVAGAATAFAGQAQRYLNFTRAHEKEADRLGIKMLAGAKFDPYAMAAFFELLQKNSRYYDKNNRMPDFLSTHPITTDRVAESRDRAANYPPMSVKKTPNEARLFALARAKLLVSTHKNPDKLLKRLQKAQQSGRFRDERALRYGLALTGLETGQTESVAELQTWLVKQDGDQPIYHLLAIRLAAAEKNHQKALNLSKLALQDYPNDRILGMYYARLLLEQHQAEQAKQVLLGLHADTVPAYHQLLAQAWQALGNRAEAVLSLSYYHDLKDDPKQAIQQLIEIKKDPQLDYYVASRVTARIAALQQLLDQQESFDEQLK